MLIFLKEWLPVIVAVGGWIYTLFTDHNKIKQHDTDIKNLWSTTRAVDTQLASINMHLTELNVKVEMLLNNKVKLN